MVKLHKQPDPTCERETLYWKRDGFGSNVQFPQDTHKITFDLIDGKPDLGSVKMERIK